MKLGVSIIVPVYNAECYINQCIQSIINELRETDELILINDGSKDDSEKSCNKYIHNNVRVVSNINHGVSYTRNCGINISTKEYVMFVDADDYLLSGWRNSIEEGINTGCDVVYFQEGDIPQISQKELLDSIICYPKAVKKIQYCSACWGKLFKRKYLIDNNIFFEERLINGEDGVFSTVAAILSSNYAIISTDCFYFYRTDNGTSATHSFNEKFFQSNIHYAELMKKQLEESQLFSEIEVKNRVNYIILQGLFLLTIRISYVNDKNRKNLLFSLYEDSFYQMFYREYKFFSVPGVRLNLNYVLVKCKLYSAAIGMIRMQSKVKRIIKRR